MIQNSSISIGSSTLIFLILLTTVSCNSKRELKQDEKVISGLHFDNDSARNALLSIYLNEEPDSFKLVPTVHSSPILYDFKEIEPLFKQYCTPCHFSKGGAPFSLESYANIRKRSKAIKEALISRIMPPWSADDSYQHYYNTQAIPDSARSKIIHWIDQACLNTNKLSFQKDEAAYSNSSFYYHLPQSPLIHVDNDSDGFELTVIDPQFTEDIYIDEIRFVSSNPSIIHHYGLIADTSGMLLKNDTKQTYDSKLIYGQLMMVDAWAKGMKPVKLREGLAIRLPQKTKFLLETHYQGYGNSGKTEQCSISLGKAEKPEQLIEWKILKNMELFLPANEVLTQSIVHTFEEDVTIIGISPHTHYIAKKLEAFIITPENKKINLLSIPHWSYTLQNKYLFEEEIHISKGSTFYLNTVYDNTEDNPDQPNSVIRDLTFGPSSYDEMLTCALIIYTH